MDTSVTISAPIAPIALPPDEPKRPGVTGKVRRAIDLMVQRGLKRDQAAEAAGMKDNSLYVAFRRPEVKAYYLDECERLRLSLRARGIHRMGEVQEQSVNLNAAVAAYKALNHETAADVLNVRGGTAQTPGFLITIVNAPGQPAPLAHHERAIEGKANDINGPSSDLLERPTDATCRDD